MLVVLSPTVRTRDVLQVLSILTESFLNSCFFHFGLQTGVLSIGAEGRNASLDSLLLILISSTLSTVNLFIGSNWGVFFAGHSIQNPFQREAPLLL